MAATTNSCSAPDHIIDHTLPKLIYGRSYRAISTARFGVLLDTVGSLRGSVCRTRAKL